MKGFDRHVIFEFILPPICMAIGLGLIAAVGIGIYLLIWG